MKALVQERRRYHTGVVHQELRLDAVSDARDVPADAAASDTGAADRPAIH